MRNHASLPPSLQPIGIIQMLAKLNPIKIAPVKMKGRRRPNLDLKLSEMLPIIGSVMASHSNGMASTMPTQKALMPRIILRTP